MARITWLQSDGTVATHDVPIGLSLMRGAVENGVDGIIAECGGACACATCQVLVDPAWVDRIAKPGPLEESMIEDSELGSENVRLSCQIEVTADLDGLVVQVPSSQH